MSENLQNIWLRLERAESHINEIEAEITSFFQANPYKIITYKDRQSRQNIIKIRLNARLPKMLPAMIGDAAANIRSPLDYVVGRVFETSPHPDVDGERLSFPIVAGAHALEPEIGRRKIATFSPDLADIIREAKPYSGGNNILFGLHHLARKDRHLDLSVIGLCLNKYVSASFTVGPGGMMYCIAPDEGWQSLNGEVALAMVDIDDFEVRLEIPMDISVRKPEVFQGEPIASALRKSLDEVKRLILIIEQRFFA